MLPGSALLPLAALAPGPAPMRGHGRSTKQPSSLMDRAFSIRQDLSRFRTGFTEMGTVGAAAKRDAIRKTGCPFKTVARPARRMVNVPGSLPSTLRVAKPRARRKESIHDACVPSAREWPSPIRCFHRRESTAATRYRRCAWFHEDHLSLRYRHRKS